MGNQQPLDSKPNALPRSLNPSPHIYRHISVGSALGLEPKGCWFEPICATLLFFPQCSPVDIYIFPGEEPQSHCTFSTSSPEPLDGF